MFGVPFLLPVSWFCFLSSVCFVYIYRGFSILVLVTSLGLRKFPGSCLSLGVICGVCYGVFVQWAYTCF